MVVGSHPPDFRLAIPASYISSHPTQQDAARNLTRRGWPASMSTVPTATPRLRRSSSLDSIGLSAFAAPGATPSFRAYAPLPQWPRYRYGATGAEADVDGPRNSLDASKDPSRRNFIGRLSYATPWAPRGDTGFSRPATPSKAMLRCALVLAAMLFLGTIGGVLFIDGPDPWGLKSTLESTLESYGVQFVPLPCSNPYSELGRLRVDPTVPEVNKWMPYDSTCTTPDLMFALRSTMGNEARAVRVDQPPRPLRLPLPKQRPAFQPQLPLPWLFGKTVVLLGDHVERLHNKDFCRFAGGKFISIGADHPLSPPPFHNGIDEKLGFANHTNFPASRPTVCYIEQYDFMMISVFHYGFINRIEAERENLLWDNHFYPPVAFDDRATYLAGTLLKTLDRQVHLIEFSSGVWDLRHFSVLDELAKKSHLEPLSPARLAWYSQRLQDAFAHLAEAFPGVPLSWRTLQQTPLFEATPFGRVAELDQVSRKIVEDLNAQYAGRSTSNWVREWGHDPDSSAHGPPSASTKLKKRQSRPMGKPMDTKELFSSFLFRVNDRISGQGAPSTRQIGLSTNGTRRADSASRRPHIQLNEWGALMLGQPTTENHLYTPPLPGGYLWGDILLFMLEKEFRND